MTTTQQPTNTPLRAVIRPRPKRMEKQRARRMEKQQQKVKLPTMKARPKTARPNTSR